MQNFIVHAYLIECQSNLHVGSGDNNYGVIDKQVQRDSVTQIPIIHASGLKGAFREYFEKALDWGSKDEDKAKLAALFGSDKNEKGKDTLFTQGALRFFEARLLSIPVRAVSGQLPFYRATSSQLIDDYNKSITNFNASAPLITLPETGGTAVQTEFGSCETIPYNKDSGEGYIGENSVSILHGIFKKEVVGRLPVIARNSLNNGQSENLWYEEIVPRESRFYFFIAVPEKVEYTINTDAGKEKISIDFKQDFDNHLIGDGKTIQIGANATVGYGYCKLSKITTV